MDKRKLSELLGLHPYGSLVMSDLQMVAWGRDVIFACVYDPGGPSKPVAFKLVFKDCREMRWKAYAHLAADGGEGQPATAVVDFRLGKDQHRSPAQILTDHFGVSLYYGEAVIQNGENRIAL
jgi:hypothetical protein